MNIIDICIDLYKYINKSKKNDYIICINYYPNGELLFHDTFV